MLTFQNLTDTQFQNFADTHADGNYLQTLQMRDLLKARGLTTHLIGVLEDDQVVAAALMTNTAIRFGQYFQIDGGWLGDYSNPAHVRAFLNGVDAYANVRNGLFLRITPNKIWRQFDEAGHQLADDAGYDSVIAALTTYGLAHEQVEFGWTTAASPAWQFRKDLRDITDVTALQATYSKDVTYYLKKNKQFGIQIREIGYDELGDFKALTQHTADRLDYHDKDLDFYQKAFKLFGDQAHFVFAEMDFNAYIAGQNEKIAELDAKLAKLDAQIVEKPNHKKLPRQRAEFADQRDQHIKRITEAQQMQQTAGQNKVVIAGALFLETPAEMIYLYSGTYDQYKHFYGPYQVQDYMLKMAVEKSIPSYNFYGISGIFDGTDGVLKFKQGFGGLAEQKVGSFIMPINPPKYWLYKTLKKVLGR
ncbi:MAG TPA: aminoacyltransferase [Lactobacillaceae bacterium]